MITIHNTTNDRDGAGVVEASEPPGEGDGGFDVNVDNDNDNDGGGGGQYYVDFFSFVEIRIVDADFDRHIGLFPLQE
eukprot:scaffold9943_cov70-Skeletonema_dohrnii-CCMP3373.AAC.1